MTKPLDERQLIDEIKRLHEADRHQAIIDLVEAQRSAPYTREITGLLARAYNNLEYGSEQIAYDLLMSLEAQSEDDSTWHFRVAYSLFYMDKYDQSLSYFERCKALNPTEENVDYFIDECHKMISLPVQITPFRERVDDFWQEFSDNRAALYELASPEPIRLVEALDKIIKKYFDFIDFEIGVHDAEIELVLSPNGMLDALIAINYLVEKAPQFDDWRLTIGRSAMEMGMKMFDVDLAPEQTYCRIEKGDNKMFTLHLYHDGLSQLHRAEPNKALQMAYIYSDTYFGELFMMQHCDGVEIDDVKGADHQPLAAVFKQIKAEYQSAENYPFESFMAYQMQFESFDALREDVVIGNALNGALINQYYNEDNDIVSKNLGNGIVYFFLYYDNRDIDRREVVNFRGQIEDCIAKHYGSDVVLCGGATGSHFSYIDLISYDFRKFMMEISDLLADFKIKDLAFSVYRKGAVLYSLSEDEKQSDEGVAPILYRENDLAAVEAHIEKYFGKVENVFHEIVSPDIHVDIHIIEPSEQRNYYTLVTTGMGAFLMNIPEEYRHMNIARAEVMINLPANWDIHSDAEVDYWPLRWLKVMARLPIEQNTWLGYGHSIPNSGSFAEMDRFAGLMLMSTNLFADGSEVCQLENGEEVNFYTLIPLYQEELDFKIKRGSDELIGMFEKRKIGLEQVFVVNINRPSAIGSDHLKPLN